MPRARPTSLETSSKSDSDARSGYSFSAFQKKWLPGLDSPTLQRSTRAAESSQAPPRNSAPRGRRVPLRDARRQGCPFEEVVAHPARVSVVHDHFTEVGRKRARDWRARRYRDAGNAALRLGLAAAASGRSLRTLYHPVRTVDRRGHDVMAAVAIALLLASAWSGLATRQPARTCASTSTRFAGL
jgi:hypothetical protein